MSFLRFNCQNKFERTILRRPLTRLCCRSVNFAHVPVVHAGHLPIVPGDRDCCPTCLSDDAAICGIASPINASALLEALRFVDCHCCSSICLRSGGRTRRHWTASAGFRSFLIRTLYEPVGRYLGRVPLDHLPSTNIAIDASTVSNGQLGVAHDVLRPAVSTDKVGAVGECWGAHRDIICASAAQYASGCGGCCS
jgi:hypothetical protein